MTPRSARVSPGARGCVLAARIQRLGAHGVHGSATSCRGSRAAVTPPPHAIRGDPRGIAVDTSRCPEEGHARRNKPLAAPETLCVLLTTARARARLKGPRLLSFDGEKLFVANVGAHFRDIVAIREQFPFDLFFCDAALYVEHLVATVLEVPVFATGMSAVMATGDTPPPFFGL